MSTPQPQLLSDKTGLPALTCSSPLEHALARGAHTLCSRGLVIVGMSVGNSYFQRDSIGRIVSFVRDSGCSMLAMVTDKISEHNYQAMGWSKKSAERSAQKLGQRLRGTCLSSGFLRTELIDWTPTQSRQEYKEALAEIRTLYQHNRAFSDGCNSATHEYLVNHYRLKMAPTRDQTSEAVQYLLKELALVASAKSIFGTESASYLYHTSWPIYERFVSGEFDGKPKEEGLILFPPMPNL